MPGTGRLDARKRAKVGALDGGLLVVGVSDVRLRTEPCRIDVVDFPICGVSYTPRMKVIAFVLAGLAAVGCDTRAAEQPSVASLTIENLIDIKHPSNPIWSPDGKLVLFTWDRAGIANLYVTDGASAPRALTNYDTAGLGTAFWADAQTVFFTRGGDLWRVSAQGGAPARGVDDAGRRVGHHAGCGMENASPSYDRTGPAGRIWSCAPWRIRKKRRSRTTPTASRR